MYVLIEIECASWEYKASWNDAIFCARTVLDCYSYAVYNIKKEDFKWCIFSNCVVRSSKWILLTVFRQAQVPFRNPVSSPGK